MVKSPWLNSSVSDASQVAVEACRIQNVKKLYWQLLSGILVLIIVGLVIALAVTLSQTHAGHKHPNDGDAGGRNRKDVLGAGSTDWLHYYWPSELPISQYQQAAVSSANPDCSGIGRDMLQQGGSAVDAAIATAVCLSFAEPQSSGIGGGFIALVYDRKEEKVYAVNAREVAPMASNSTMYVNKSRASVVGNMAIAVPGEIAGFYSLHQRFGKLPWRALFEPTIRMSRLGAGVSPGLVNALRIDEKNVRSLRNILKQYTKPDGVQFLQVSDTLRDPLFARTLERIADDPMSFYNGSLADDLIDDACEETGTYPCVITRADLQQYRVQWKTPVSLKTVQNTMTYMMPLPSSSFIRSLLLNAFDLYGVSTADFQSADGAARFLHRQTEVSKFAFAVRTLLGDDGFASNFSSLIDLMLSRPYADTVRSKINDSTVMTNISFYLPPSATEFNARTDRGTTHLSVIDSDGNAVSMTSTVNDLFGSRVKGSKTGVLFNNEMDDFSIPDMPNIYGLPPGTANYVEPFKHPLSSMSPTIVLDERKNVKILIGAAGGPRILSSTIQCLIRLLYFNDTLKQAMDAPRLHHQYLPNILYYEGSLHPELTKRLKKLGHQLQYTDSVGIVHGIQILAPRNIQAFADPRAFGRPAGY